MWWNLAFESSSSYSAPEEATPKQPIPTYFETSVVAKKKGPLNRKVADLSDVTDDDEFVKSLNEGNIAIKSAIAMLSAGPKHVVDDACDLFGKQVALEMRSLTANKHDLLKQIINQPILDKNGLMLKHPYKNTFI